MNLNAKNMARMPTGTLIKKIYLQLKSTKNPPSRGPISVPTDQDIEFIPTARPRSSCGNAFKIMGISVAVIIPAPMPSKNLEMIIKFIPGDNATKSDDAVNNENPVI